LPDSAGREKSSVIAHSKRFPWQSPTPVSAVQDDLERRTNRTPSPEMFLGIKGVGYIRVSTDEREIPQPGRFLQNPGAGYLYEPRAIENVLLAQASPKQTSDSSAIKMPIREGGVFDGLEVWLRLGRDADADV
jgi:hypothetical protein